MHLRPISRRATGPMRGAVEGWNEYEESWLYLMLFLIASVFVPQKL